MEWDLELYLSDLFSYRDLETICLKTEYTKIEKNMEELK